MFTTTTLTLFASSLLAVGCDSSGRDATAKNECIIAGDRILLHALIRANYTTDVRANYTTDEIKPSRDLWQLDCSVSNKSCNGVWLALDNIDRGHAITMVDLNRIEDAELVSVVGSVATIRWGPLRTFTIDFDHGHVTYVESGQGILGPVEGRGEASCQVSGDSSQLHMIPRHTNDQSASSDASKSDFLPVHSRVSCFTMRDPKLLAIDVCTFQAHECVERALSFGIHPHPPYAGACREADSMFCYSIGSGAQLEASCYGDRTTCMLREIDAEDSQPRSTSECTEVRYVQ